MLKFPNFVIRELFNLRVCSIKPLFNYGNFQLKAL